MNLPSTSGVVGQVTGHFSQRCPEKSEHYVGQEIWEYSSPQDFSLKSQQLAFSNDFLYF